MIFDSSFTRQETLDTNEGPPIVLYRDSQTYFVIKL